MSAAKRVPNIEIHDHPHCYPPIRTQQDIHIPEASYQYRALITSVCYLKPSLGKTVCLWAAN